jgi:VIT1/CCC1 family predicted Fe2+/Mn2+ transporter
MDKNTYFALRMKAELRHERLYTLLSERKRKNWPTDSLKKLTALEKEHARIFGTIGKTNYNPDSIGERLYTWCLLSLSDIAGLAFAIKLMEYAETGLDKKIAASNPAYTQKEKTALDSVENQERRYERVLQTGIVAKDKILISIRDLAFGMNDGLVELLGVVAGLAVAINNPTIVLLGGFIVAVSGTLSMGGGAYLSTKYEETITSQTKTKTVQTSAARSAFYVGFMYFIGALFPLSPFALGVTGMWAIVLSIMATAVALTVVSGIIAIIGNASVLKRIAETLLISLGIAAITIIIGTYARSVLKLPVGT